MDYNDYEEWEGWIINILNQKSYKDKVDKPLENIIEHFEYNKKLIALQKDSYPPEVLKIFDDYKDYKVSKDIREVEYQLIAEANSISSILDII